MHKCNAFQVAANPLAKPSQIRSKIEKTIFNLPVHQIKYPINAQFHPGHFYATKQNEINHLY